MPILVEQGDVAEPRDSEEVEDDYRLHRRFDRMGRLVGDEGMRKLLASSVTVIGLGGVGSHCAEALIRAGVGRVVLVDFDKVCITNSNRQLQAMKGTIGKYKVDILAERLERVNPRAEVVALRAFYNPTTADEILAHDTDLVVDAIDNVSAKVHLLATCRERSIPAICSTGASGRMDPTAVQVADLAHTSVCGLASEVRRILRKEHAFPEGAPKNPLRSEPFGIPAVFSTEAPADPLELHYDRGEGFRCVCPQGTNGQHDCDQRRVIYGTAGYVTAAFGLACASSAVRHILEG